MSDARSSLRPFLNDSVPTLLATWPGPGGVTHLLLKHYSGDHFNASFVATFPAPFPEVPEPDNDDGHPFAVENRVAQVNFIAGKVPGGDSAKVEGMAWKGMWGAGPGINSPKGEGKEGAEVWFDRVA